MESGLGRCHVDLWGRGEEGKKREIDFRNGGFFIQQKLSLDVLSGEGGEERRGERGNGPGYGNGSNSPSLRNFEPKLIYKM